MYIMHISDNCMHTSCASELQQQHMRFIDSISAVIYVATYNHLYLLMYVCMLEINH